MMNLTTTPVITFTKAYLVSCCIGELRPEELLIDFIRSVSYDALINNSKNRHLVNVSSMLAKYIKPSADAYLIPEEHWAIHGHCLKALKVVIDNRLLHAKQRRRKVYAAVKCAGTIIKNKVQFVDKIVLVDGQKIDLTPDFIVVCFMHGVAPEDLISYFISQVNLMHELAVQQFGRTEYDPLHSFFTDILKTYCTDRMEFHGKIHYPFLNKMKELHHRMRLEPSLKKRLGKFNALANRWCKAINNIPVAGSK